MVDLEAKGGVFFSVDSVDVFVGFNESAGFASAVDYFRDLNYYLFDCIFGPQR